MSQPCAVLHDNYVGTLPSKTKDNTTYLHVIFVWAVVGCMWLILVHVFDACPSACPWQRVPTTIPVRS